MSAFRKGCHLSLSQLADGPVTRFLFSDNAPAYLTLLYALLIFRRRHELAPLHGDFYDEIRPAAEACLHTSYSMDRFAQDVEQLADWGCVKREVEPARIRGYKDRRREHYRYSLTDDTVSFLEWLEDRLEERVHGKTRDGRDLLLDLTGRLRETHGLIRKARAAAPDPESSRRMMYLLLAAYDETDMILEDLTSLRAELYTFARGTVSAGELRRIVSGLEQYADQYLRRLRILGREAYMAARRLLRPSNRTLLDTAFHMLKEEGGWIKRRLKEPGEILSGLLPFLEPGGRLIQTCARVEGMASEVISRIHRHLRDLEHRNFRLEEWRSRLVQIARRPENDEVTPVFLRDLTAFAHFPNDPYPSAEGKTRPPAPRQFRQWAPRGAPETIRRVDNCPDRVFQEENNRRQMLRQYVYLTLLSGRKNGRLSEASLKKGENPFTWLETAKAHYLGQGRVLKRAGVSIALSQGTADISADQKHLEAPDHTLTVWETNA